MEERTTIVIPGWHSMSYFSDMKSVCWFLEPGFAKQVVRLHNAMGNATTKGHHIVVGMGSSQLYLAAPYALSPQEVTEPMSVISAVECGDLSVLAVLMDVQEKTAEYRTWRKITCKK